MPVNHESTRLKSSRSAASWTCRVHAAAASALASMRVAPALETCSMHALTQSTFCSMQRGMLQNVETLCGPTSVKRFGKPGVWSPR